MQLGGALIRQKSAPFADLSDQESKNALKKRGKNPQYSAVSSKLYNEI